MKALVMGTESFGEIRKEDPSTKRSWLDWGDIEPQAYSEAVPSRIKPKPGHGCVMKCHLKHHLFIQQSFRKHPGCRHVSRGSR